VKRVYLHWEGEWIHGLRWDGEKFTTRLLALPRMRRKALLLFDDSLLQYKLVELPFSPRLNFKKILRAEGPSIVEEPSAYYFTGRVLGKMRKREGERITYLICAVPRREVEGILELLHDRGVKVEKVISPLDLLIERGRDWAAEGNGCLVLIDQKKVYILFFREGNFVFYRTFTLTSEVEGPDVGEELAMELRRSSLYLQQEFKVGGEWAKVVIPPRWFTQELAEEVTAKGGLRVELLHPPSDQPPWLQLMAESDGAAGRLLSLAPPDVKVLDFAKRHYAAITLIAFGFALLTSSWAMIKHWEYREERAFLRKKEEILRQWEPILQKKEESYRKLQALKEEAQKVSRHLQERSLIYLPMETFAYITPRGIHLKEINWERASPSPREKGRFEARGRRPVKEGLPPIPFLKVVAVADPKGMEARYDLFQRFISDLKEAPFVEEIDVDDSSLLQDGTFEVTVRLRKIVAHEVD